MSKPARTEGALAYALKLLLHYGRTLREGRIRATAFFLVLLTFGQYWVLQRAERLSAAPATGETIDLQIDRIGTGLLLASTYLAGPLLVLLLAFSFMHASRLVGSYADVKTYRAKDGWGIALIALLVIGVDALAWWVVQPVKDQGGQAYWTRSHVVAVILLGGAMGVDRLIRRRFVVVAWALAFVFFYYIAASAIRTVLPRDVQEPFVLRTLGAMARAWTAAVVTTAVVYGAVLWLDSVRRRRTPSHTREIQFRYMKAIVALLVSIVSVYLVAYTAIGSIASADGQFVDLVDWRDAADEGAQANGPPQLLTAGTNDEHYRLVLRGGLAWIVSMPLITLVFAVVGLVFVQDVSRVKWRRNTELTETTTSAGLPTGVRRYLHQMKDDLGLATASITAIVQAAPLQIGLGALLNMVVSLYVVFCTQDSPLAALRVSSGPPLEPVILINIWLGSVVAWIAPFVAGMSNLNETLQSGASSQLTRSLSRAEGHIVLAGYGDLGRRVLDSLFRLEIIDVDTFRDSWDLYLPNGDYCVLIQGLVIVDRNREAFEAMSRTPHGDVGIVRLGPALDGEGPPPREDRVRWEMWRRSRIRGVLGICGDVNDRQVLETARVRYAQNYVSLARDPEAVFTSSDYLRWGTDGRRVRSVLASEGSASSTYLGYRGVRWPVTFVDLSHMRGVMLAKAAADILRKRRARTRVLLAGGANESFQFVDSLVRFLGERLLKLLEPEVGILTTEGAFVGRVDDAPPPAHLAGWDHLAYRPLYLWAGNVPRHEDNARIEVYRRALDPTESVSYATVMDEFEPQLVIVMEPKILDQLLVAKAAVMELTTWGVEPTNLPPLLLIGVETGRPGRTENIGDAGRFYFGSYKWQSADEQGRRTDVADHVRYPRQFADVDHERQVLVGDAVVDVLDDPSQRIVSIIRSHRNLDDRPVEVSLCLRGGPGALAEVMCRAASLEWTGEPSPPPGRQVPSLQGSRMYVDQEGQFFVQTTARLHDAQGGSPQGSPIMRGALLGLGKTNSTGQDEALWNMFATQRGRVGLSNADQGWWSHCCPDMPSCPVAMARMQAESRLSIKQATTTAPYFSLAASTELSPCAELAPPPPPGEPAEARLTVSATDGLQPGILAKVLSALLFRVPEQVGDSDPVFNLVYAADEPCHNEAFSVVTLYGNVRERKKRKAEEEAPDNFPLRCILIRPITGADAWNAYLTDLREFVVDRFGVEVELRTIERPESGPFLLGLFRRDDDPIRNYKARRACSARCGGIARCRICREIRSALDALDDKDSGDVTA